MRDKTKKPVLLALLILLASVAGCIGTDDETELETLTIAFEIKDDYTNVDENPQQFADYLGDALDMNVELYPIDSEGAILESLRFGNADIAFMDGA
ncbi:MAG: PhnD/SsuA/transferrin family substrate-binding protein, partial [Candidatus Poseidoniaceae archaeon]